MSDSKNESGPSKNEGEAPRDGSAETSAETSVEVSGQDELSSLVRGALQDSKPGPDILGDVQKRLRQESEGRFYADGWSVEREPPVRSVRTINLLGRKSNVE